MVYRQDRKLTHLRDATHDRGGATAQARLRLGLTLAIVLTCLTPAPAQSESLSQVPVTLLSDHVVHEAEDVFMMTAYPLTIADDQGKRMIAPANSYLRCKAGRGEKDKNSLPLTDCEMLFQPIGQKDAPTYTCSILGGRLSVRWRNRLFWDQLVNAGETWQGAVGSFAIGSTVALFTTRHTIMGVGTAVGFALTGVGPLAKHHPAWFLPSKKQAVPDNRALLFSSGKSTLQVTNMKCVGDIGCPPTPGPATIDLLPRPREAAQALEISK